MSSFLRIYSTPLLDMAYHLAYPDWCYVLTSVHGQPRFLALANNLDAAN